MSVLPSLEEEQNRRDLLIFEAGMQLGAARQTLLLDKLSLSSASKSFENEILQLKEAHRFQFQVLLDEQHSIRVAIDEKIKTLVQKVETLKTSQANTLFSTDVALIGSLLQLTKITPEGRLYPDYPKKQSLPEVEESNEETALILLENAMISTFHNEMKTLRQEVITLRKTNRGLVQQKEEMVTFHTRLLQERKDKEKPYLTDILAKVRTLYQKINWSQFARINENSSRFDGLSPGGFSCLVQHFQTEVDKKVLEIRELFEQLIKTLERHV